MKVEEILEILDKNYNKFIGTNEAEINFCTEIENEFNKKQSEIDELVEFINDAHFESFTEQDNANKLIQKHTKK